MARCRDEAEEALRVHRAEIDVERSVVARSDTCGVGVVPDAVAFESGGRARFGAALRQALAVDAALAAPEVLAQRVAIRACVQLERGKRNLIDVLEAAVGVTARRLLHDVAILANQKRMIRRRIPLARSHSEKIVVISRIII